MEEDLDARVEALEVLVAHLLSHPRDSQRVADFRETMGRLERQTEDRRDRAVLARIGHVLDRARPKRR